jgi:hypothetical protein
MAVLPSPLSNSIANINETTVSGNIFGGNRSDSETKSIFQSLSFSVTSLQNQVSELSKSNISNIGVFASFQKSFLEQINNINLKLSKVDDTLESVASIITSENLIEKQKDFYDQQNQKRLAEAGARQGQESILETKIQSALSEPINRIGNKVAFGFQNLMGFITTLLGGWLTLEGIAALKAYQDDNKKSLDDIKNSVIKTLLIAGGIFGIINFGIFKFIGTITKLSTKIGAFILKNTVGRLFGGILSIIKGTGKAITGVGAREAVAATKGSVAVAEGATKGAAEGATKGGFLGNIGKAFKETAKFASPYINPILGMVDFGQRKSEGQTNIQAAGGAVSSILTSEVGIKLGSKFPGWTKLPAMALLGAGGYVLGGMGSDKLTGVDKPKETRTPEVILTKENKNAEVAPTTSMTPSASTLQINSPDTQKPETTKPAPTIPMTPTASTLKINPQDTSKPATPAPSPKIVSQFEQAWNYRDNPLARGRIEGAWNKMSDVEKQQAKDWATSKGYDWKEMKLPDISKPSQKTPEITPAQTSKISTLPFNIGPEPDPKPTIVYASSGSSTAPSQQPLKSGPASDVPAISSSNPDNFYTLYSQINYNVMM